MWGYNGREGHCDGTVGILIEPWVILTWPFHGATEHHDKTGNCCDGTMRCLDGTLAHCGGTLEQFDVTIGHSVGTQIPGIEERGIGMRH